MFDKVVFAGGGHRCWWQAGFWEVLRAEIELRPRVIGAVSTNKYEGIGNWQLNIYTNEDLRSKKVTSRRSVIIGPTIKEMLLCVCVGMCVRRFTYVWIKIEHFNEYFSIVAV